MDDRQLLRHVHSAYTHWRGGSTPPSSGYLPDSSPTTVRQAHRLVRTGLLKRERFSEQVRGEPRFYWWAFYLTDAGKRVAKLEETHGQN